MDWSKFALMAVAGTLGAWLGLVLSRYLRRRRGQRK